MFTERNQKIVHKFLSFVDYLKKLPEESSDYKDTQGKGKLSLDSLTQTGFSSELRRLCGKVCYVIFLRLSVLYVNNGTADHVTYHVTIALLPVSHSVVGMLRVSLLIQCHQNAEFAPDTGLALKRWSKGYREWRG